MSLMPSPDLELRNEERLAAESIARTSGNLTVEILQLQIAARQELLKMAIAGTLPAQPVCPELTNANPSAPHTVLLEAMSWLLAQIGYRLNQIPQKNLIEFARVFGVELRPAAFAQTSLRFTVSAPNNGTVTIPANTEVADASGEYVFETTTVLQIVSPATTGTVTARRIVAGQTLLAPNVLTDLIDSVAFVESVTNPSGVDSGSEIETVESALERARRYQRRGERIVTAEDLEDAILDDVLNGVGIVRAFPFVRGDFYGERFAGHTSVIVATSAGDPIDAATRTAITNLFEQIVGNQFVYLVDPVFVDFNVSATLRLTNLLQQNVVLAAVERNLRAFYRAGRENFAKPILRSEIIAVIEGTDGVDRIVTGLNEPILASPVADARLRAWELTRLQNLIINVV